MCKYSNNNYDTYLLVEKKTLRLEVSRVPIPDILRTCTNKLKDFKKNLNKLVADNMCAGPRRKCTFIQFYGGTEYLRGIRSYWFSCDENNVISF